MTTSNFSKQKIYQGMMYLFLVVAAFISLFPFFWMFGWKKLSAKAHAFVMWLVAIAGSLSAIWILAANSWMQHPVGYAIRNGRAELTDFQLS